MAHNVRFVPGNAQKNWSKKEWTANNNSIVGKMICSQKDQWHTQKSYTDI